jgi:predicted N-acetyltransferase YhbS
MLYLTSPPSGVADLPVTTADHAEMGRLHDRIFGPGALTRTAYRVREGLPCHSPWCRIARADGRLIAMARFSPVTVGGTGGVLMLGPVAVEPAFEGLGHARRLVLQGAAAARADGLAAVMLVGDLTYYGRLGFIAAPAITMPGPVDPARVLALELASGALAHVRGVVAGDRGSGGPRRRGAGTAVIGGQG